MRMRDRPSSLKRIVLVVTRSDRAGAQKHLLSIVNGLQHRYDFHVIVGCHGYLRDRCRELEIRCSVATNLVRSLSPVKDFLGYFQLRKMIADINPDLVHVHSAKAGFLGRMVADKLDVPVIYTVHGWAFSDGNSGIKKFATSLIERYTSSFTSFYIFVSHYDRMLGKLRGVVGNVPNAVVFNGIASKNFDGDANRNKSSNEKVTLLTVTRLVKQKNISRLVKVVSRVKGNFTLDIVGYGPERDKLESLVDQLGLREKVNFLGEVENVESLLQSSDIFLLSSEWEGLPISLIEACRHSLPMVATNVGGVSEIIDDGVNGYLIPCSSHSSFSHRIDELISSSEKRYRFGLAAKQKFEKKFTLQDMLAKTDSVYQEILGSE